jgi:hypothetical protein
MLARIRTSQLFTLVYYVQTAKIHLPHQHQCTTPIPRYCYPEAARSGQAMTTNQQPALQAVQSNSLTWEHA